MEYLRPLFINIKNFYLFFPDTPKKGCSCPYNMAKASGRCDMELVSIDIDQLLDSHVSQGSFDLEIIHVELDAFLEKN
ncbi:hypothetical protein DRW41_16770 [Neobacillus piezotolerans]|uniref:Uncharacterized protein n=1 Tax=Neobacillus piezotolerans TaxID=2259171 RepID=A0A3D8GN91_9BACI|nr:hypothetical protein DRW41_16770 [Neobacillus piezotolerans]